MAALFKAHDFIYFFVALYRAGNVLNLISTGTTQKFESEVQEIIKTYSI